MPQEIPAIVTRFRAYQLGNPGSSFSYFAGNHFTLIEGRCTDLSWRMLCAELSICQKNAIDTLHITSWDRDHCQPAELSKILDKLRPRKVEYPGYEPHTETGRECLALIQQYKARSRTASREVLLCQMSPQYIAGLKTAVALSYSDIVCHPRQLADNSNDNSTVKLFRRGMFNVASLGDVEDEDIGAMLRRGRVFSSEIDVMILAHHGSDNGITSRKFINTVRPAVAICSSDWDNQYSHPSETIRAMLYEESVRLYTTKTGDVIVRSTPSHRVSYEVVNLISDSDRISSSATFRSKKADLLRANSDTLRERAHPGFKGMRR